VPLYLVGERPEVPWEMALTPELFPVEQLAPGAHPFAMPAVLRTPAMMVEPARYLTALRESVIAAGGQVVARRFADRAEVLALPQPVIVNCLGLGARTVFGDTTVEPIKGELVILDAQPGIDYAVIALDVDAYLLPRESSVVVGGSFLRGDWSTEVGDATVERILAGARALFAD